MALYFQNFRATRYRALEEFSVEKLRRVNVIGGLNGSGKSTFLEALFVLADHLSPFAIIRPLMFRGLGVDKLTVGGAVFSSAAIDKHAMLEAKTRLGLLQVDIVEELQPPPPQVNNLTGASPFEASTVTMTGLTITANFDGEIASIAHAVPQSTELATWIEPGHKVKPLPICVMQSRRLSDSLNENSERFGKAVIKNKKSTLVRVLQIVAPRVVDVLSLQISGQSILFAALEEGPVIPIAFLGDGASALVSAVLAIIDAEDGAVFFDELDATVHFSLFKHVWIALIRLARELNCQIFIASHSQEAIDAIAAAAGDIGATEDFQYIRLDRTKGGIKPAVYQHSEFQSARSEGWEVR